MCEIVAIEAIRGLYHIPRVKGCRLTLLQHPRGVDLVCDSIMASSNVVKVSPGMLLVTHLLWDTEWREPILKWHKTKKEKGALPIEKVVVQWAAFCMKYICEESEKLKEQSCYAALGTSSPNVDRQWLELEFQERFADSHNRILCRCLILLSTLHHAGTERLFDANALEVAVFLS
jgi:hypothetical protein